jgi:DNA repair exonuclease SbcCD ATPase subunit
VPFTRIEVTDFQSIASADVELGVREGGGGITTVVGPSSTGKSALLRAIKMAVRNVTSPPVRSGAKKTVVKVTTDDHVVEATRGKALSTYVLDSEVFSKAGVSVPEAVTKALGLREGMHFMGQFDAPFLLNVPGSVVSNVIGELTNASVLRAAVREGARRAQHAKQEQAIRTKDAMALATTIRERFAALPAREAAFEDARKRVLEATEAQGRIDTLASLVEGWEAASRGLETVSSAQRRYADVFPKVEAATEAVVRAVQVEDLVSLLDRAYTMKAAQEAMAADCAQEAEAADSEYNKVLVEAGVCPTCGAKT